MSGMHLHFQTLQAGKDSAYSFLLTALYARPAENWRGDKIAAVKASTECPPGDASIRFILLVL